MTRPQARLGTALIAAVAAIAVPVLVSAPAQAAGTSHYVDCSASVNGTGTSASPWNAVSSVNAPTFGSSDQILFKAGTTCTGQLSPHGSGTAGSPITMTSYGSGAKPIIDAAGATGAVLSLVNVQQWEISGLELRNSAASPAYRSGIFAENSSGTTLHHLKISDMTIRNISGWSGGWYSRDAGVGIQTDHTSSVSTWDDITIANNTFDHVDRIPVAVTPDADGQGTGLSTNVVISDNTMTYSGGDDILVVKGSGAVISGNTTAYGGSRSLNGCPPSGQYCNGASASIWMSGSTGTVVENNSVSCFVNEADGQAYDVDWGNHDTTVQYNYSRANRGGSILIMDVINVPNEPTSQIPSDGTVVRYNISEDDTDTTSCPTQPARQGPKSVIHFEGNIPNQSGGSGAQPQFVNNTYFVPASVSSNVVGSRAGASPSGSWVFENNLIENFGSGGYITTSGSTYRNNLFFGNHPSTEPAGTGTLLLDPQLTGPLPTPSQASVGASAFALRPSSPALNAGTPVASAGGVDYFGTAVAATPSIGAAEGTDALLANPGFESGALGPWYTTGSGTASTVTTSTAAQGVDSVTTGPMNSGVEQAVTGLTPGATYLLSSWLKVATAGEQVALGVKGFGGTDTYARTTSTSWAPIAVLFTEGTSSTTANVYCYKNAGSGAGYCDSFSLQRLTAPSNLVGNPGFESGSLTPWTSSGSGSTATVTSGAADRGSYGLATGPANSGAQQTVTGLVAGHGYVLLGWLRSSPTEQIALGVKDYGGAELYTRIQSATYSPAVVSFTTATNVTSATIYCYKNTGSSAGACDDFTLVPLG